MDLNMRNRCFLSARIALLGAIGKNVLGISINIPQPGEKLRMTVYHKDILPEDEIDALQAASVEMLSNFYPEIKDDVVEFIKWRGRLLPRKGEYVFLRFGVGLE